MPDLDATASSPRRLRAAGGTLTGPEEVQLSGEPADGRDRGDAQRRGGPQPAPLAHQQGPRLQRELPGRHRQVVRSPQSGGGGGGRQQHGHRWALIGWKKCCIMFTFNTVKSGEGQHFH